MTKAQLLDLLREARVTLEYVGQVPTGERNSRTRALERRIDAALAESRDSTPPVVEWHKDEFFGNQTAELDDERCVGVAKGRRVKGWWWSAGGNAPTEEEAKAKAVALAGYIE